MSNQKKQTFLGGAAILTFAVVVVKLIGAFYKFPLNNILGAEGKTYFNVAYYIYNVMLSISTAGLPLALSKLVSEARAQGRGNQERRLFKIAMWMFLLLGVAGSAFMFFGTRIVTAMMRNEGAYWAIRTLAPSVFCVCLLSCMRGYTQGQGNMKPTAMSQVLEAICKLGIGLPAAWYILRGLNGSLEVGAAGAILGVTIGTVLSMFFFGFYMLRHRDPATYLDTPESSGILAKRILAIGIPITLSNSAMSIITLVDTSLVLGRLQDALSLTEKAASTLNGQYSMAMDLVNLPPAFVYPVTMSLIPFAAAAMARRDSAEANRIVSSAFRLVALLAIPAGVGLSVLGTPICVTVYPTRPEDALAAGPHLQVLGFSCIFICIMILTNAILQSYNRVRLPIMTVIVGGLTKIVMNYILVGDPDINIHGAPVSTLCCYVVIAVLNLFFVWKYSPEKPKYLQIFAKPVLASALMGGTVWAVYGFADRALSGHSAYMANAAATVCGIFAGVVVYGVLVIALRILRAEDVKSIPHGAKIIKLLHLK